LEEIEQQLLRGSSESAVPSQRPNGESLPAMLTVEELERKLRSGTAAQTDCDNVDVQSSSSPSLPHATQPTSTVLAAILSGGSVPVTRIPGLLPVAPGSIPVRYTERCRAVFLGHKIIPVLTVAICP